MLCAQPAFGSGARVMRNAPALPRHIPSAAKDLLGRLLDSDPTRRLASAFAVKQHPFFEGVDWNLVAEGRLVVPFNPMSYPSDAQHFDARSEDEAKEEPLSREQNQLFSKFG